MGELDVAAYKWVTSHHPSAYSAKQELRVLHSVIELQKQNQSHLDMTSVMVFTQIQMDLSKQIESYWFKYWNNPNTPAQQKPNQKDIYSLTHLRKKIEKVDRVLFPKLFANI